MSDTYNIAVIGAGSGGLVTSAGASGLGAKVVLIEKHKMGGDCLNTGCVPSKALIKSAKVAHTVSKAASFGVHTGEIRIDFPEIMERVQNVIRRIEPHDSPERFRGLGVDVQFGPGHLISKNEVSNGEKTFRAKKIVLATGSRPRIPDLPGLDRNDVLHSDNVWEIRELPKRLVVLGGGPIGVELAQCFHRFGSQVTVVTTSDRLLPRDDSDAAEHLLNSLKKEGMNFRLGVKPLSVQNENGQQSIILQNKGEKEIVHFDKILVATGRLPNIESLKLENAGVESTPRGIKVDDTLRTNVSNIFAVGDLVGPYLFTHTADYQAKLVIRNALFPGNSKADYRVVPWCTYSDPEVAQVGITEREAVKKNISVDVVRYDLADLDRAICDGTNSGFVKAIVEKGKDKILGATLVGEHAGDLMHEIVLAMKHNLGLKGINSAIHAYPTLAEGPKRTSDAWMRTKLTPKVKNILTKYFAWSRR